MGQTHVYIFRKEISMLVCKALLLRKTWFFDVMNCVQFSTTEVPRGIH